MTTVRRQGSDAGVARLAAPVLRHFAEHPEASLSETEVAGLAGVDAGEARGLIERLQRAGLLAVDSSASPARYTLIPAWEQRSRRSRPLILLVEDHTPIASMTEALLTSEGFNVVLSRNPMEAHALLRAVTFDVILADSFSPTLDLAVRVLGPLLRRATGTPVVLFTAHHWNAARVQAEGFTELITKPFDVEPFLARIEQLAATHSVA